MSSKKALIVDDSRLAQFVLKKMLIAQKMDVDTSESAEEALGYLKQHKPDVIFLDHSMPGMNGLEALKIIKDNPRTAPIPVMMYTSQEDSAYMVQAKSLGAVDVLPKQLTTADLQQVLNKLELDKKDVARITTAANESITSKVPEKEQPPLEILVKDAESALHHEVVEQQFQRKLKQQQDAFEQEVAALHEKINNLIPAAESSSNRQNFWNNILWAAIYCITVIGFVVIYFQQKTTIEQLSSQQPVPSVIREAPSAPMTETATAAKPIAAPTNNQTISNNADQLASLENLLNTNNQIPMDELLLSDTVLTSVNELIPALTQLNFSGRVSILAHDGNFCVNTGNSGQSELAPDDLPVTQCQMSEASERLADIASIDLLRAVTASNQTSDRQFVIIFDPQGSNQPLDEYPAISDEVTAGEWNTIAFRNRRVEFELIPAR